MKFFGIMLPLLAAGKGPAMDLYHDKLAYNLITLDGMTAYHGDYTWQAAGFTAQGHDNSTWAPWTHAYLNGLNADDVSFAKGLIDAAATHGTKGLRVFTAAYDLAGFSAQGMCHQATGDKFNMESHVVGNNRYAKLQWQVKELALMVRFGLADRKTFKLWAEELGKCAGFIPGQDNFNFKQIISRDLALFEAAATTPLPVAAKAKISKTFSMNKAVDFGNAAATKGEWFPNEAFFQGAVIYDRLFTGVYFPNRADTSDTITALQAAYGAFNCAKGGAATAILSIQDFKDAEKFAFQLAMSGMKSDCGDATTFKTIATSELAEEGTFTSTEKSLRQHAYMRALNAVGNRAATIKTLEGKSMTKYYLAGVILVLGLITFLTRNQRQMFDKMK